MTAQRVLARAAALADDDGGVERAHVGGPPVAFRIWRQGSNKTDHGEHFFTARSAELLMADQASRGNLYVFDLDHASLNPEASIDGKKAIGWHRLEVRAGALWAVACEWVAAVAAALVAEPPEFRYFSPAYDISATGEIVRYLNTAITNSPATWNVTALASRGSLAAPAVAAAAQKRAPVDGDALVLAILAKRVQELALEVDAWEALPSTRLSIIASRPDLCPELVGLFTAKDASGAYTMPLSIMKATIKAIPLPKPYVAPVRVVRKAGRK